jgi:hypothetical protein
LKLWCGCGAWDEISGRRHRDLFYLWHRDGPLAANRASSRGFYFGELAAAFLLIAAAIFLLAREHLRAAAFLSRLGWFSASLPHLSRNSPNQKTTF